MADDLWKAAIFRQRVATKIDEAIRQSRLPTSRNSMEMENHIFQKAKTKEEYLDFFARLILHIRGMNRYKEGNEMNGPGGPMPNQMGGQLAEQMTGQISCEIAGQIPNTTMGQMSGQLPNQLQNQLKVGGPLGSHVQNQLQGQLQNQLGGGNMQNGMSGQIGGGNQMPNQLQNQISNQLPNQMQLQQIQQRKPQDNMMMNAQAYREKVRKLSKYIDPLLKIIARMENAGEHVEMISKMRTLVKVLSNPSQQMPLDTLLKCEVVLKKLDRKRPIVVLPLLHIQ